MLRPTLVLLIIVAISGCDDGGGRAVTRSGGSSITTSGPESTPPEPAPFESLALALDSSYTSEPVGAGTAAGEVREFTKLKIKFCWCPPGTFQMGTKPDTAGHLLNEGPVEVTLSKGFWLQQSELTQEHYEQLMGSNPSFFPGTQNPVESLTWTEAVEFCRRLSALPPEKSAGNLYRLPTEAEWEYACRAGTATEFNFGDDETGMDRAAWYSKNSERTTHPVAEKEANAWGLYDMHGNVAEWCQDFYADYPREPVTDPRGPVSGEKRTLRGGGWFFVPMFARSAHRDAYIPSARYVGLGFRLAATSITETGTQGDSP